MAKRKTQTEQLAAEAIALLRDSIRDLEIIAGGRNSWERRHCVSNNPFAVHRLLDELNPDRVKARDDDDAATPRIINGHVTPAARRLTHTTKDQSLFQ